MIPYVYGGADKTYDYTDFFAFKKDAACTNNGCNYGDTCVYDSGSISGTNVYFGDKTFPYTISYK